MVTIKYWLDEIRRRLIIEPITNDPRETGASGTRLGVAISWIFRHAVGGGQASFDEPLEHFSSRDRVMLYALLLQKGHVDELTHAFGKLLSDSHQLHGATVVDIGCGPFTSGLALANVTDNRVVFRYFGVDTSQAMCTLGAELAEAAKEAGGLNPLTSVEFTDSADHIDFGPMRSGWTIVILSYLLASRTIDVELLTKQIVEFCRRIGPGPVALLYTNAAREEAREAFPEFRDCMIAAGFTVHIQALEELQYGDRPRSIHYALFHRMTGASIPLSAFQR
jgi:SAM-dependent methyltransferase